MSEPVYVEVNGQVWVRTSFPEGVRYQRLVRAPLRATDRTSNVATLETLRTRSDARELTYTS